MAEAGTVNREELLIPPIIHQTWKNEVAHPARSMHTTLPAARPTVPTSLIACCSPVSRHSALPLTLSPPSWCVPSLSVISQVIPEEWSAAQQSCKDLHPGWEYKLWTDTSSEAFIADRFPQLLRTFQQYPYNIERADVIRHALLRKLLGSQRRGKV